jgi:UDP-glucose 4-epimerase
MFLTDSFVLVTGGAGYIGSHTVAKLLEAGCKVVVLDNLSNSKRQVIRQIETVTGLRPEFVVGDICDRQCLRSVFNNHKIQSVIHFAV